MTVPLNTRTLIQVEARYFVFHVCNTGKTYPCFYFVCFQVNLLNQIFPTFTAHYQWERFIVHALCMVCSGLFPRKVGATVFRLNIEFKEKAKNKSSILFKPKYDLKNKTKVKRCLNSNAKFRVLYDTKKMSFYCNIKDEVRHNQRNHVIYKTKCPGCNGCYIGKTEQVTTEHGTKET